MMETGWCTCASCLLGGNDEQSDSRFGVNFGIFLCSTIATYNLAMTKIDILTLACCALSNFRLGPGYAEL